MKTILMLVSSMFLLGGCSLFGPSSDVDPELQKALVTKAASAATQVSLTSAIKDLYDRKVTAMAVVFYAKEAEAAFFDLVEKNSINLSLVEGLLEDSLDKINSEVNNVLGYDVGLDLDTIKMAIQVLLNHIAPNGVKDEIGIEDWQLDLIRCFFDGVIEGGNKVVDGVDNNEE